ncbi:hypothetical protein ABFX02_13G051300 [Erythranthe guttata]
MVDEEGTRIGVVIFKDEIQQFNHIFENHKSYAISNGQVQQNNQDYFNAHPLMELVLKKYTTVKEIGETINVDSTIVYNFMKFPDIDSTIHNRKAIDVCGIVIKVKDKKKTHTARGATKYVREITLMDNECHSVIVSLWEDMATNEGGELQEIAAENPVISLAQVTARKYQGELQLQTTMASIMQIYPTNDEVQHLQAWLAQINDPLKIQVLAMKERIKKANKVTLHEIIHNRFLLSEDEYYFFKATVNKVENKSYIWYDSCTKCNSAISKNGDTMACRKCNIEPSETTPRYRLLLNVTQENERALITIFEEAAMLYVGCAVNEYLMSVEKEENDSKYFRGLSLQTGMEFQFLIALNKKATIVNGQLNVVAEAIEKIQLENQIPTKHVDKIVQRKKNKTLQDEDEILMGTSKAKNSNTTTKRRQTKKNINCDENVYISSDDDETIQQLFKKIKKKSNSTYGSKDVQFIQVKKEKS